MLSAWSGFYSEMVRFVLGIEPTLCLVVKPFIEPCSLIGSHLLSSFIKKDSVLYCLRFLFNSDTVIPKNLAASFFERVADNAYLRTASLVISGSDFQMGKP